MPQASFDINRIVEKVLDQIAQEAKGKNRSNESFATVNIKNTGKAGHATNVRNLATCPDTSDQEAELFVADRVVTLGRIEKQLAGKKRLAITPGAVLTPSVRDYLKEHQIAICTALPETTGSTNSSSLSKTGTKTAVLVAAVTSYDPTSLLNRLTQQRFQVDASTSSCLIETTDHLAEQLADPTRLGVILTTHHAAAVCLANRHKTLRAISVSSEDQLDSAVAAVGANVLIVTPHGRSSFQLDRMITRFLQLPKHACPDALKARLG